jgi:hypothetical protein
VPDHGVCTLLSVCVACHRWAPVIALLLRLHAAQLPPSFVAQLLGTCSTALTRLLTSSTSSTALTRLLTSSTSSTAAGQVLGRAGSMPADAGAAVAAGTAAGGRISSSGGGRVASPTPGAGDGAGGNTSAAAVWLLRVLYEVAAAWPAVACAPSTYTTSGSSSGAWPEGMSGADSSMAANQSWQQQWHRVWTLVESSLAGLVRQLSEDQSSAGQTESAATNAAGSHPLAAAATAHLWLLSAVVQQQLLPAQQLLQGRPSVAQTLLPLLQAAADPTSGARDAGRANVLEAACGLLLALYGCMGTVSTGTGHSSSTSSSSWAGTSPQEQAVPLQLLQAAVQLVTSSAAAAADGIGKAGHRSSASGLPTLLVPLIELLSSCPSVSAGVGSTPAAAAAAALDAPRGCHQWLTRFPSGSRKLPLVRLPLEALQLDLGGAAAGAGWWLSDAGATRQECDLFRLQSGLVQLSWLRFELQQQQLAAGQQPLQQQQNYISGSRSAMPLQGAAAQMGVGAGAGWWCAADAAARSVLQVGVPVACGRIRRSVQIQVSKRSRRLTVLTSKSLAAV